ncbi:MULTISPECIES: glycosyl transferase [Methylobacterium]|uniref:Undecaprenyl-phosphate N-acetylglucosaminyl 1-phosphate transferase n=2 Tax=Pseudomonadota TaxID=1224 RepID=A0ABQ4STW6_9HYPH|nr:MULTISPECIES: glycosyl transferase [Methylobacterium]PIU07923.1 MAG: glycosyl transferase [Methylobacterium sp. CG09_land_8_20_14_0_10_71_15]PIU13733.1 MAG: glycosyl transferase [Methylobacterium sp. CG08_land_8_20_14_0_20_71_15]GBU17067.1 glycosyl transferase [Methylobacterium sp.]GJE06662.1 putative undecaprenyl-phosphate N-acetylglucosaminyl 1-phosphate transferase [Methylobacterium jeotgali]
MPSVLTAIPLAAGLSAGLILILKPLLQRYALARPNARSSHTVPTPQGGGIAVVGAAILVAAALSGGLTGLERVEGLAVAAAAVLLALVGAVDDIRPLPAALRLGVQALVVAALVTAVGGRLLPDLPLPVERALAVLAGLWFVNLVNFMDGLDWMTVAEMVPVTGALVLLGLAGTLPPLPSLAAAALLGGLLGFAPFNRPVARLFLGDVGSLPIGLIVAWLLYRLALEGGLAAAVLLPMFYLADASLTLLRRLARRERVWEAHRTHFYQRATVNGLSVRGVVARVFAVNVALALLAAATLLWPGWPVTLPAMAAGIGLVAALLARFARPSRRLVEG